MGFINWVKSKFDDDEDEIQQPKIRQNKVKTIRVKQPSSFSRPDNIQQDNVRSAQNLFSGGQKTFAPERRNVNLPKPKSRSLVDVAKDNVNPKYSSLRQFSDFTNQLQKQKIEQTEQVFRDRGFEKIGKAAGTAQKISLLPARATVNTIPYVASMAASGIHRLGRSAKDQYAINKEMSDKMRIASKQPNPKLAMDRVIQQSDQVRRDFYANKPDFQYSPITGNLNSIQQESAFRQDVLGQSKLRAGVHSALDIAVPFLDIPTGGSGAALATAGKSGVMQAAPLLMGALNRSQFDEMLKAIKLKKSGDPSQFNAIQARKENPTLRPSDLNNNMFSSFDAEFGKIAPKQIADKDKIEAYKKVTGKVPGVADFKLDPDYNLKALDEIHNKRVNAESNFAPVDWAKTQDNFTDLVEELPLKQSGEKPAFAEPDISSNLGLQLKYNDALVNMQKKLESGSREANKSDFKKGFQQDWGGTFTPRYSNPMQEMYEQRAFNDSIKKIGLGRTDDLKQTVTDLEFKKVDLDTKMRGISDEIAAGRLPTDYFDETVEGRAFIKNYQDLTKQINTAQSEIKGRGESFAKKYAGQTKDATRITKDGKVIQAGKLTPKSEQKLWQPSGLVSTEKLKTPIFPKGARSSSDIASEIKKKRDVGYLAKRNLDKVEKILDKTGRRDIIAKASYLKAKDDIAELQKTYRDGKMAFHSYEVPKVDGKQTAKSREAFLKEGVKAGKLSESEELKSIKFAKSDRVKKGGVSKEASDNLAKVTEVKKDVPNEVKKISIKSGKTAKQDKVFKDSLGGFISKAEWDKTFGSIKKSKQSADSFSTADRVKFVREQDRLARTTPNKVKKQATADMLQQEQALNLKAKQRKAEGTSSDYIPSDYYKTSKTGKVTRQFIPGGKEISNTGGGKEISKMMTKTDTDGTIRAASYVEDLKQSLGGGIRYKGSKSKQEYMVDVIERRGTAWKNADGETRMKAEAIKKLFDTVHKQLKGAGAEMGKIKHYFPHKAKKSWISGVNARKTAQHLVDTNQVDSFEKAKKVLADFASETKRTEGRKGEFEFTRKYNLPEKAQIKNLSVAEEYLNRAGHRIAELEHFGVNDKKLNNMLLAIQKEGGDDKRALDIVRMFTGEAKRATGSKTVDAINKFQDITLLSPPAAGIKNLTQSSNTMIEGGVLNYGSAAVQTVFDKEARAFARRSGAVRPHIVGQESGVKAGKIYEGIMIAQKVAESILRTTSAIAGRNRAIKLVSKRERLLTKANPSKKDKRQIAFIERAMGKMNVDLNDVSQVKNGALTEHGAKKAALGLSDFTQFNMNVNTMPVGSRTQPFTRFMTKYLNFPYKQSGFLKDAVIKEAKHGNFAPMARLAGVVPVVGVAGLMAANLVNGKDPMDIGEDTATKNFLKIYGSDMLGNLASRVIYAKEKFENKHASDAEKVAAVASLVGGVNLGTLAQPFVARSDYKKAKAMNEKYDNQPGDEHYKDPMKTTKRMIAERVPVGGRTAKNVVPSLKYEKKEENKVSPSQMAGSMMAYPVSKINKWLGGNKAPRVARVIDGDTIILDSGQRVRMIGFDSPEKETAQGVEAKKFAAKTLLNKDVDVRFQVDKKGEGGRLLGDVYVDGKPYSKMVMEGGLAWQSTFDSNVKNVEQFDSYQTIAKQKGAGMWGDPNMKVDYKGGFGKDPGFFRKIFSKKLANDLVDFDEDNIKEYKGMTASDAKSLKNSKGYSDEDILDLRATADGFADHYIGVRDGPKVNEFAKGSLTDKLAIAAVSGSGNNSAKNKLVDVYTAGNYTNKEKNYIMKKMGFTMDDAERVTLKKIKGSGEEYGRGMRGASPVINDYMREKGFTDKVALNLIDDKTLTGPQIKNMFEQDLITYDEKEHLFGLLDGKTGTESKSRGKSKGGSRGSSKSKKVPTIKFTASKTASKDYFKGLTDAIKAPKIKLAKAPKFAKIKADYKYPEVKSGDKERKIKFKFKTGLNK